MLGVIKKLARSFLRDKSEDNIYYAFSGNIIV